MPPALRSRFRIPLAFLLVALLGAPVVPAQESVSADASTLKGKLTAADGSALAGADVLLFHLSSERSFETTSRANGSFEITGLPYGYFDLAIRTADGFFVANSVVNVPPSDALSIDMRVAAPGTAVPDRSFPGANVEVTGTALVSGNVTGTSFWSSPKGIGILAGGGAAALLLIAGGSDSDPLPSPSAP